MFKFTLIALLLISQHTHLFAQTTATESDVEALKKRVSELEEIQRENSTIIKRQLADQHFDQNSRGYLELKLGLSHFNPESLEDENDDLFKDLNGANWEGFENARIMEAEIGKSLLITEDLKHEFGVGYQMLSSKMSGSFNPSGGGAKITVREKISINTLYARYSMLNRMGPSRKLWLGPGLTIGYSPSSELKMEIEQNDEGVQVKGEGTSYLIEVFGKAKLELSRYFTLVGTAGYRIQEAKDLRLNAADIVTMKTTTDIDSSGFFATVGFGVAF